MMHPRVFRARFLRRPRPWRKFDETTKESVRIGEMKLTTSCVSTRGGAADTSRRFASDGRSPGCFTASVVVAA